MHLGAECIGQDETLAVAAAKMRDLHVGALPICGTDDRLHGIITDRDIVVRCVAEGRDPQTVTAEELAQGTPIWVDVDSDVSDVLRTMEQHKMRQLPVIDNHRLVGMISEADMATHLGEHEVSEFACLGGLFGGAEQLTGPGPVATMRSETKRRGVAVRALMPRVFGDVEDWPDSEFVRLGAYPLRVEDFQDKDGHGRAEAPGVDPDRDVK
jgi:CBS-domain-containing membrane protein